MAEDQLFMEAFRVCYLLEGDGFLSHLLALTGQPAASAVPEVSLSGGGSRRSLWCTGPPERLSQSPPPFPASQDTGRTSRCLNVGVGGTVWPSAESGAARTCQGEAPPPSVARRGRGVVFVSRSMSASVGEQTAEQSDWNPTAQVSEQSTQCLSG